MTPNEFQKLCLRTENTPNFIAPSFDTARSGDAAQRLARIMHGMIGICTEAGELQDQIKKHLIYGRPIDSVNVMEETADVLWYCALTLDAAGFSLEDAMIRVIDKLKKRYPDKFSFDAANNRNADAERAALEGIEGNPKG